MAYGLGGSSNYQSELGGYADPSSDESIAVNSGSIGGKAKAGGGAGAAMSGIGAALTASPVGLAFAAFQAYSAMQQAEMTQAQGEVTRKVSELNAKYAETDAYEANKAGFTQVAQYQNTIDKTLGQQSVAMATADVDANYGTAAQIQSNTVQIGFLNKLTIEAAARAKALGYQREADNIRLNQSMSRIGTDARAAAQQQAGMMDLGRNLFDIYKHNSSTPNMRTANTTGAENDYW